MYIDIVYEYFGMYHGQWSFEYVYRDVPNYLEKYREYRNRKSTKIYLNFQTRNFTWKIFDRGSHYLINN